MRSAVFFGLVSVVLAIACSSKSGSDAGADAQADATADLCDLDAFKASGGDGHACPQVTSRVCFPICANGGCRCIATANGPRWKCTTDLTCLEAGTDDDGSADSGSPDAGAADTGAGDAPAD